MKFKLFCGFTFILVLLVAAACFASPKAAAPNPSQDLTDSMASATVPSGIKGLNKHPSNPLIIENFPAGQNSVKIAAASPDVPQAVIQDSNHEFSPVVEGTQVVHDFIVQNKGNAPLIIEKVKTDWGCTVASYTKQIPPGGEGKITVKVNTGGYGGKNLNKSIVVHTNQADNPRLNLSVSGPVNKFVTITPKTLRLTGPAKKKILRTATIILEEKYPFTILGITATDGKNIRFSLQDAKRSPEKGYLLTVENLKKEPGRYFDTITLQTDSTIQPLIYIRVYGDILNEEGKENK